MRVTAFAGCAWTAQSNARWIAITSGWSGLGSGVVGYVVDANAGSLREGTLVIAGHPFPVTQAFCPQDMPGAYVLPWPVGSTYRCRQSWGGLITHHGAWHFAVDFEMPIGTRLTAARPGVVEAARQGFFDTEIGTDKANVVVVRQDDGSYARYCHLTHNGALVKPGTMVATGDPIGLSGSSGSYGAEWSAHLHFDVTIGCPQPGCQTIPYCFRNTAPQPNGPVVGVNYTAEPY